MKEMRLQELMDLVVVVKLSTTLLNVLDPVKTCILSFRRKTLLHSATLHLVYKHTRNIYSSDVLFERG
jgi:hypothetical protein